MSLRKNPTDRRVRSPEELDDLSFWENGLLPVVTQDARSGQVLMVAFANREALERTLETGHMHYWSRSRQEIWHKGATSGSFQDLISLHGDCDGDALLARVHSRGPACHTGEESCFGATAADPSASAGNVQEPPAIETPSPISESIIPDLWAILVRRARERPPGSYTVRLLDDENLRLKKLGEEVAELLLSLARGERRGIAEEGADLVYHLLVGLLGSGVSLEDLLGELEKRMP